MGEQVAVVWVRRSDWERVTEREELVGRLRVASRLPQYLEGAVSHVLVCVARCGSGRYRGDTDLMTAMLTGAVVLAR